MRNGPYILIKAPDGYPGKRYRNKYAYEHHVVWWRATGQTPNEAEVVHHVDGNRHNNDISNLRLLNVSVHKRHHGKDLKDKFRVSIVCPVCGTVKDIRGSRYRSQTKKGYKFYCSRKCQHKSLLQGTKRVLAPPVTRVIAVRLSALEPISNRKGKKI